MSGRSERALASFDEALKLNPRYVEALIHQGIVLSELGHAEQATFSFAKAREYGGGDRGGVGAHHAAKLANLHAQMEAG